MCADLDALSILGAVVVLDLRRCPANSHVFWHCWRGPRHQCLAHVSSLSMQRALWVLFLVPAGEGRRRRSCVSGSRSRAGPGECRGNTRAWACCWEVLASTQGSYVPPKLRCEAL